MSQSPSVVGFMPNNGENRLFANNFKPSASTSSEYRELTRTMTHARHVRSQNEKKSEHKTYAYQTVHLHYPVPPQLQPMTTKELLHKNGLEVKQGEEIRAASPLRRGRFSPVRLSQSASINSTTSNATNSQKKTSKPLKSVLVKHHQPHSNSNFKTLVSFDTVNLGFSDHNISDDESHSTSPAANNILDEEFGFHSDSSRHSRFRSPSPMKRDLSPMTRDKSPRLDSPRPRSRSSSRGRSRGKKVDPDEVRKYPTTPIIVHDAVTLTRKHKLFDKLYSGDLKPKSAVLPNRNILCYVSGRRHTWVSIDWCCNQLLEDGDTLIIIASIKPDWDNSLHRRLSSGSVFASSHSLITEESIRSSPEYAKVVAQNLMKYTLAVIDSQKIIKISIELGVGNTKDVLKDMYSLYMPSVVVTSAKPTGAASTKSWLTSRVTDRLVKNFPVPVIIVPAKNLDLFQTKLFKVLDDRMQLWAEGKKDTEQLLERLKDAGHYNLNDQLEHLKQSATDDKVMNRDIEEFLDSADESESEESDTEESEEAEESDEDSESDGELSSEIGPRSLKSLSETDENSTREIRKSTEGNKLIPKRPTLLRSKTTSDARKMASDISSDDDTESYSSCEGEDASIHLKHIELNTQFEMYKELNEELRKPITEESFEGYLGVVSDVAYEYGIDLAESAKKGGEEATLVRTMTGAPDVSYFKPKSMLLSTPSSGKSSNSRISPISSRGRSSIIAPKIKVDSPHGSRSPIVSTYSGASGKPRQSTLKFQLAGGDTNSGRSHSLSPRTSAMKNKPVSGKRKHKGFFKKLFGRD